MNAIDVLCSLEGFSALITLVFLEIILGIDNIIFISIVANKLPKNQRAKAWRFGLLLALVIRVLMLFTITWIMQFSKPLLVLFGFPFSVRDLILLAGGLFLIYKSTMEISHETSDNDTPEVASSGTVFAAILQIVFIDFIFSFDSILTAIGLSNKVAAVLVSIGIMMIFLGSIGDFIKRHPSMEVLALAFLILIGFILVLEAFHYEIPKGYIYFAVAFSFTTELLNIRRRRVRQLKQEPDYSAMREAGSGLK
jgi:predicted tellurium resistance membrane protein TerC